MMMWAFLDMFMDDEVVNTPIAFTLQRYWLAAWSLISLVFSLVVLIFTAVVSLILSSLKKRIN